MGSCVRMLVVELRVWGLKILRGLVLLYDTVNRNESLCSFPSYFRFNRRFLRFSLPSFQPRGVRVMGDETRNQPGSLNLPISRSPFIHHFHQFLVQPSFQPYL